jgi:hypothetical protein
MLIVVISVSAGLFEKNYAVNERPAVFADKRGEKRSQNKGSKVIDLHEGTKVYVSRRSL